MMKRFAALVFAFFSLTCLQKTTSAYALSANQPQADLVAFSYNRPLQLYAYLESLQRYVHGISSIQIICRADSEEFKKAYDEVQESFPHVHFIYQGDDPHATFKPLLLEALFHRATSDYFMFGVDDLVVTDFVDVSECIKALEQEKGYGFYLRLGKNITECYTVNQRFTLPVLVPVSERVFTWHFSEGKGDWSLPISTDMTIYRKDTMKDALYQIPYDTPNSLETNWAKHPRSSIRGLCFTESKVFGLPLNVVQEDPTQRSMSFLLPEDLLEEFNLGFKMDIEELSARVNNGPVNKAPHMEHVPTFIKRTAPNDIYKEKYFCTVADAGFFPWLIELIGSIHKTNSENLGQIAVFDLGFTSEQRSFLDSLYKVRVYDLEQVNDQQFGYFQVNDLGKRARGHYSWKPVAIKQALDMFDYVLYLDAGSAVLKPLDDLFTYIQEHGYFILQDQVWNPLVRLEDGTVEKQSRVFTIGEMCVQSVRETLASDQWWVLNKPAIIAGVQGLTRKVYDNYVVPMYRAAHYPELFADDGSAPCGFGWGRHDQTLFSIRARLLDFDLVPPQKDVMLSCCGKDVQFHFDCVVAAEPHILYQNKGQLSFREHLIMAP